MSHIISSQSSAPKPPSDEERSAPSRRGEKLLAHWGVAGLGFLSCAASFALYLAPLGNAYLQQDDFQILLRSWTWQATVAHLWVPANEHFMPLGRLSTWLMVQVGGRMSTMPLAAILQGPLGLLAGMWLVYFFVRRELGQPFYGLLA